MNTAIILAGGLGTRLRSIVQNIPKPMAPIHGRPFLEYLLRYWRQQGVSHFILSVGYLHEQIIDYFGDSFGGCSITYAVEKSILGTGGAFFNALSLYHDTQPIIVMNGDTYFTINYENFLSFHKYNNSFLSLALCEVQKNDRYAEVLLNNDNMVVSCSNICRETSGRKIINGGIYLIDPMYFKDNPCQQKFPTSLEQDVFTEYQRHGLKIYGKIFDSLFIDIGVPNDYSRAFNLIF